VNDIQCVSEISTLILISNKTRYPIKIIERFGFHYPPIIYFPDADNRRTKNKCKKTFTYFFANLSTVATTAPVAVTYNDKGGGEKRESYGRY
jgi:hypothetical protein